MDTAGGRTRAVEQLDASPFQLHDTSGNVQEWGWDRYAAGYPLVAVSEYTGSGPGDTRVVRGGGWASALDETRSALHADFLPTTRRDDLGFRLVRSAE